MATKNENEKNQFLTCILGGEGYGLPIGQVREIIQMTEIRSIPEVSACMKGVINLRDKVIPVFSLRGRLGMAEADYDERTCIIVVEVNANPIGLIVDAVSETTAFRADEINHPPMSGPGHYISGIARSEKGLIILLDLSVLSGVMVEQIAEETATVN